MTVFLAKLKREEEEKKAAAAAAAADPNPGFAQSYVDEKLKAQAGRHAREIQEMKEDVQQKLAAQGGDRGEVGTHYEDRGSVCQTACQE
eukprot:SAG22_NODE_1100_length_5563_cov_24.716874_5_plen_89_part_00